MGGLRYLANTSSGMEIPCFRISGAFCRRNDFACFVMRSLTDSPFVSQSRSSASWRSAFMYICRVFRFGVLVFLVISLLASYSLYVRIVCACP